MKHTCPSGVQRKHLGDGYAITLDRVDAEYMTLIARKGRSARKSRAYEDQFPDFKSNLNVKAIEVVKYSRHEII